MKNNKMYLILAILCVWLPLFMGAWDKDKPASSTSLRSSNPQILANWSALETSFGAFHEFSTGGTNSGENVSIKFNAPISTPDDAANKLWIYGKDVGGKIELHILDEDDNEIQMSSAGDLFSSTGLIVTGTSTFNSSATLGAGDDLIGSATSDITFNTNKFTVAGATGNTLVAGTLDVTGKATLGDTSVAVTQSANDNSTQIATTAYADVQAITTYVNFSTRTSNGAATVNSSRGVTGVARTAAGKYLITWSTAFSDGDYVVNSTYDENGITSIRVAIAHSLTTTTCDIALLNSTFGITEPTANARVHVMAIGTQ